MKNGSVHQKNGLIQQKSKVFMIIFQKVPRYRPKKICFLLLNVTLSHLTILAIQKKQCYILQNRPIIPQSPQHTLDNVLKKSVSQHCEELNLPLRNTFNEPVSNNVFWNCLKASRERGSFKILPTDGAREYRPG